MEADTVVVAIGYRADEELPEGAKVQHERDLVVIDRPTGRTTRPGVFAGGDCVNGADLVVTALADGRRAAEAIHAYLERLPKKRPTAIAGVTPAR
ncbi:MAG: FAD-dependent oxidoreductase [Chloroflexi bacterium]|nr:FAD-dependent oxidoreductase [Chloroflexota bacterium]